MIKTLRQPMTRTLFAIGTLLALGVAAQARDQAQSSDGSVAQAADDGAIETIAAVVHGLSHNDLLNVRATASPIGLVLARIPNGTMLTRLECATSRNTQWCRVEVPELDGLVGWTPARYLHFARDDDDGMGEGPAPLPVSPVIDPSQITVGILPDPLPMPEDPLAHTSAGSIDGAGDLQTVLLAPASDGAAVIDAARETQKIDGAATELTLAYATRSDPAATEVYSAFEAAGADATESAGASSPSVQTAVPLPSPRPPRDIEAETSAAEPLVAALPSTDAQVDENTQEPAAAARSEPAVSVPPDETMAARVEVQEMAAAPAERPIAQQPEPPVAPVLGAPDATVALSLPPDNPEEAPQGSPHAPEPEAIETPPQPVAPSEPSVGETDAVSSDQTLREQLAALLPSWSRPAAQPVAQSEPEPVVAEVDPAEALEGGDGASAPQQPAAAPAETPAPAIVPSPPAALIPVPAAPLAEMPEPAPAQEPQIVAQAPLPERAVIAGPSAEIPCARYVGQPMARCEVRVLRLAADDADIFVVWPDGGERLIRFRGGQPDSTNGRGDFRFSREAELNLIRIGAGERFEILDALPFAE